MRLKQLVFLALLGGVLAVPAPARADWIFTPYIGSNFGGNAKDADISFKSNLNFGGSLAFMGAGVFGFEMDFGYSPNFFDNTVATSFDGHVTSLMGNVIIGIPVGGQSGFGVRPYVSGGAGLLRTRVNDVDNFFDVNENSFGVDAGGGLMVFFTNNVGIRGDIRYFRSIHDNNGGNGVDLSLGSFDFWRADVGLSFRF